MEILKYGKYGAQLKGLDLAVLWALARRVEWAKSRLEGGEWSWRQVGQRRGGGEEDEANGRVEEFSIPWRVRKDGEVRASVGINDEARRAVLAWLTSDDPLRTKSGASDGQAPIRHDEDKGNRLGAVALVRRTVLR